MSATKEKLHNQIESEMRETEIIKNLKKEKHRIEMDRYFLGVISQKKADKLYEIEKLLCRKK